MCIQKVSSAVKVFSDTPELVLMNGSHYCSDIGQIKLCSQTDLDYMIRQAFMGKSDLNIQIILSKDTVKLQGRRVLYRCVEI